MTGIHQDCTEEDVRDAFGDFGTLNHIHLNLDRRTGYAKGYALIEFLSEEDGSSAIKTMNQRSFLGRKISVDWAFVRGSRVDTFAGKRLQRG